MTTEQRWRTVEVEYDVTVCNGGSCENRKPLTEDQPEWISIRKRMSFDNWDFCSYACLAEWAKRQAEKDAEAKASEVA